MHRYATCAGPLAHTSQKRQGCGCMGQESHGRLRVLAARRHPPPVLPSDATRVLCDRGALVRLEGGRLQSLCRGVAGCPISTWTPAPSHRHVVCAPLGSHHECLGAHQSRWPLEQKLGCQPRRHSLQTMAMQWAAMRSCLAGIRRSNEVVRGWQMCIHRQSFMFAQVNASNAVAAAYTQSLFAIFCGKYTSVKN